MVSPVLSDSAANVLENVACRVAAKEGGRITPNHLLPFLPVSLDVIMLHLDSMVDNTAIYYERKNNQHIYGFTHLENQGTNGEALSNRACLSCETGLSTVSHGVLCSSCAETFNAGLSALADKTGWPGLAVYEHEILYLASKLKNPVHIESLAARSRYTINQVRQKLRKLVLDGHVSEEIDENAALITYSFPPIDYPKDAYDRNMQVIQSYPASYKEEVETKLTQILFALGCLVLVLFALAFLHIPFPILIVMFFIFGPGISFYLWRRRKHLEEE